MRKISDIVRELEEVKSRLEQLYKCLQEGNNYNCLTEFYNNVKDIRNRIINNIRMIATYGAEVNGNDTPLYLSEFTSRFFELFLNSVEKILMVPQNVDKNSESVRELFDIVRIDLRNIIGDLDYLLSSIADAPDVDVVGNCIILSGNVSNEVERNCTLSPLPILYNDGKYIIYVPKISKGILKIVTEKNKVSVESSGLFTESEEIALSRLGCNVKSSDYAECISDTPVDFSKQLSNVLYLVNNERISMPGIELIINSMIRSDFDLDRDVPLDLNWRNYIRRIM